MSHSGRALTAAIMAALAGGCSTRNQVRTAAAETGLVRSYAVPFAQVQQAAFQALADASLSASEERWLDRSRWSVLAVPRSIALVRVARIVVEDHPTECRVWILVQKGVDVQEEGVAEDLHGRMARGLGLEVLPDRPVASGAGEAEGRYQSPLGRCAELVSKACLDRGYRILRQDSGDAALRTMTAEKDPARRLFAAIYRQSPDVTRVVVEVRGGTPDENREEAAGVQHELLKELPPAR